MQQVLFKEDDLDDINNRDVYLSLDETKTKGPLFNISDLNQQSSEKLIHYYRKKSQNRLVDFLTILFSINENFSNQLISLSKIEEISSKKRSTILNLVKILSDDHCIIKAKAKSPLDGAKRVRARSLMYLQPLPASYDISLNQSKVVPISSEIITRDDVRLLLERTNRLINSKSPLLLMFLAAAMPETTLNSNNYKTVVYTRQTINGHTSDYPIEVEVFSNSDEKIASVTDLRVLIAAYKIVITRVKEDRAIDLEKFEIILDDILDILGLPRRNENRITINESFQRLKSTEFRYDTLPTQIKNNIGDIYFERKRLNLISELSTLYIDTKNIRKPVGVSIGIPHTIMADLDNEFETKFIHEQMLNRTKPSGFEWKIYLWFRRSIGSVIRTQTSTLVYNDVELNNQLSPENSISTFRRKMKKYAEKNPSETEPDWSKVYGCFFRIIPISKFLVKYEFKIDTNDSLIKSSIEHLQPPLKKGSNQ